MAQANITNVGAGLNDLPFVKQIGLAVVFAASLSLLGAVVMWSMEPSYRFLYGSLSDQEMMDVTTALDQAQIKYEINAVNSSVLVEAGRVPEARMKLAGMGLPKGSGTGYELLDKDQGFGTSQFIETARYQRAIEGELSRSISALNNVQSARVHLGIPKQSAFVRNRKKPTASVILTLYQGRGINQQQSDAIAHMVASSVPNLEMEDVTVVDQAGRMLTRNDKDSAMGFTSTQFEYRQKLEAYYTTRIQEILAPIVGEGKVRAQVAAELDFTVVEQTHESYNPDLPSIRSEQTLEEDSQRGSGLAGVPGTLTNQPPGAGVLGQESASGDSNAKNSSRSMVRNYELDRTISHTKHQVGNVKRLSVAVVIDERDVTGEGAEGEAAATEPLSAEEMDRIRGLVREAVGFSAARGDSVNVINAPFRRTVVEPEPLPEGSILEQPWVWDVGKQLLGLVVALILIFVVLKPLFRNLAEKGESSRQAAPLAVAGGDEALALPGAEGGAAAPQLAAPAYESQLEVAKGVAAQDPQRVATIMKEWVEADG